MFHPQIPELTDLAKAFPNTAIIFDHFGGPLSIGPYAGNREEIFPVWKKNVSALARCDNVFAKLGGAGWFCDADQRVRFPQAKFACDV